MHELGLCEAVADAVERRAAGRPVARVRVRVGAFQHVHPDAFAQSFTMAAAGGVAEDATAELVVVPGSLQCRVCGATHAVGEPTGFCPSCGSPDVVLSGGDEVVLELVEYHAEGGRQSR